MPNAVRFLFRGNDLQKVTPATLQIEDIVPGGPATDPPIGAMRLRFRQSDPGPAQIMPLLPGAMQFRADPAAAGVVPDPATASFSESDYSGWKTLGRILVTVEDAVANEVAAFAPTLLLKPNRIWYSPVRIPPAFLFDTLTTGLKKAVIRAADGRTIRTSHPDWRKYAIGEFLAGRYTPVLTSAANAAQDDRVRFVMPTVEVPADGNIVLNITVALAQKPQDGLDTDFDDPPPPVGRGDPQHPRNGLIPAHEVYRRLRPHMVPEATAAAHMDAMLIDWPLAPRFFPIQVTRTWNAVANCSAQFLQQTITIRSGGNVLHEQRLPAHGVVFLRQLPAPVGQPVPAPPAVDITLTGTMTWLAGGDTSWRKPGQRVAVPLDLTVAGPYHVSARMPMTVAMFSDKTRPSPGGAACTYLSMRRTVRALVDNRIAGGRLNFGVASTSAPTRDLIRKAFVGTPATAAGVAANAPDPSGDPDTFAPRLEPILRAFFPDPATEQVTPTILDEGEMVYRLWQSYLKAFQANGTKRNFADAHIGRGAPGAMVSKGLAGFHVDPVRNAGEADNHYFNRIVDSMIVGLEPGALLQFWNLDSDFVSIKNRNVSGGADPHIAEYGHSPLFVRYERSGAGAVTGLRILDQNGESISQVAGAAGNRRIQWGSANQAIWIAANWAE